ncbi:hypothetical protein HAD_08490 [Hyphomonas adhaerens MHS-3]|uniref:Transport permease protein n=1 Tax=Hyphomonas adhaerens MHS-3 TaxID=1280949 RepID=A0A069E6Z4_9PROT|nr:ABC transporter permease [Hyphomonas adhaerens]KCZ85709.1 hypothetical protein HAD_08490 [Hyphomonas adhaerens MHS-3]
MISSTSRAAVGRHAKTSARKLSLLLQLTRRDIESRYRGSGLGLVWTIATPLLMLGVYTLVFGTVFKSRWAGSSDTASPMEFAVILFSGLILFQFFSDVMLRAPTIITMNASLVKRVVFPLELLVPSALLSSMFHAGVSLLILVPFIYIVFGTVHVTLLLLPLIIIPLALMITGLGWFLASLGTYIRDIGQIVGTIVTALLFLAPIFFPLSALPEWVQPILAFNPMTVPIEQLRRIMIFGELPDFSALASYTAVALVILVLGYQWFERTRKGFADVL